MIEIKSIGIPAEPYEVKTKIFWNPSVEEIKSFAIANPKTFVFTFITDSIENMTDYSDLNGSLYDGDAWKKRVAQPFYLGNVGNPEKVAQMLVKKWTTLPNMQSKTIKL